MLPPFISKKSVLEMAHPYSSSNPREKILNSTHGFLDISVTGLNQILGTFFYSENSYELRVLSKTLTSASTKVLIRTSVRFPLKNMSKQHFKFRSILKPRKGCPT